MNTRILSHSLGLACAVLVCRVAVAQNITFDVAPAGLAVQPGDVPSVVVEPGTVVGVEVGVTVNADPTWPAVAGLAGFNLNLLTDVGVGPISNAAFASQAGGLFVLSRSLGNTVGDDLLGLSGQQALQPRALIRTDFGLNHREALATARIRTPGVEGVFHVSVNGAASLFTTGTKLAIEPGVTLPGKGFTIQTRIPRDPDPGTSNPGGTGGTSDNSEEEVSADKSGTTAAEASGAACGIGSGTVLAMSLLALMLRRPQVR